MPRRNNSNDRSHSLKSVSVFCPHCRSHTALSVAPAKKDPFKITRDAVSAVWTTPTGDSWWIGICNACSHPSLVLNHGQTIYPQPAPSPTDPRVPEELRVDLDEAKRCISVDCFKAASIMARRVVESALIKKGAKKRELRAQVEELLEQSIITHDIAAWATAVRWIGNDAAHPQKTAVSKQDASDCLQLAEELVHILFVTPAIAAIQSSVRARQ